MPEAVVSRGFMKVIIHADHRNGICVKCGTQMEVKNIAISGKVLRLPVCPECGGWTGQLIARPMSIYAPDPPSCLSFRCLWKFIIDSLYSAFLSSYHRRRTAYAEANRPEKGKKILERYRTGEPAPQNLWEAIHANIKLRCPLCRKYNVDPLLFSNTYRR